jgi:hypothetical protein
MTRSLLFTLLVASALGQVCLPPRAAAQTSEFCAGVSLNVGNALASKLLGLSENQVQSTYVTRGALGVRNDGTEGIHEVLLQVEYKFDGEASTMLLTYGATASGTAGPQFSRVTGDLQPGETKLLIAQDIRVAKTCPRSATLAAVRIRLSNGVEIHKGVDWVENSMPREIPRLTLSIKGTSSAETSYLAQIHVDEVGNITGVRSLRSSSPLPETLVAQMKRWIFYPARRNAIALPSELDLVIRINTSGCKIQDCKTTIPLAELPQSFIYVDLVNIETSQRDSPGTRVYFGGVPIVEGQEISW